MKKISLNILFSVYSGILAYYITQATLIGVLVIIAMPVFSLLLEKISQEKLSQIVHFFAVLIILFGFIKYYFIQQSYKKLYEEIV